ncbi:MAG TPA: hypothetical protein VMS71_02255 [Candidatus Acidoferrum sp.]|nr:hypothetical protein [Candidatus Acidoferrum sp.]
MTVVDNFAPPELHPFSELTSSRIDAIPITPDEVGARVVQIVRQDPFATISEIRREICRHPSSPIVSWWQVFRILRKNRLLMKKSRFRLARGRW